MWAGHFRDACYSGENSTTKSVFFQKTEKLLAKAVYGIVSEDVIRVGGHSRCNF